MADYKSSKNGYYTGLGDDTATYLMPEEKAIDISETLKSMPKNDRKTLGILAAEKQKFVPEQIRSKDGVHYSRFDPHAALESYLEQNGAKGDVKREAEAFWGRYNDTFKGKNASLDNVLDVQFDSMLPKELRAIDVRAQRGPDGRAELPRDFVDKYSDGVGKFRRVARKFGPFGGVAAALAAASSGASATEIAADFVPGGNTAYALVEEENTNKAIFEGLTEIPVLGTVASELGISVCHAFNRCADVEEGLLEGLGRRLGGAIYDWTHPDAGADLVAPSVPLQAPDAVETPQAEADHSDASSLEAPSNKGEAGMAGADAMSVDDDGVDISALQGGAEELSMEDDLSPDDPEQFARVAPRVSPQQSGMGGGGFG